MRAPEVVEARVDVAWVREAIHDLSQPLTALECALFLGTSSPDGTRAPTAEELLVTIQQGLEQCERMITQVRTMQQMLQG